MFIIAPLSKCASPAKRDRFLEYISKIGPVTHDSEPKCRAYAWFRSAEDNTVVPHHWLRGLEVYEDVEANTVTHRASAEYKAFRAAAAAEGLLERPSDLQFWRPSSVGFLMRDDDGSRGPVNFMDRGHHSSGTRQYIVIDKLTPRPAHKDRILKHLHRLVREAEREDHVLSFWVLHRGDGEQDEGLLVFSRYEDKDEWSRFEDRDAVSAIWEGVYELVVDEGHRTTWIESGLGFLGR